MYVCDGDGGDGDGEGDSDDQDEKLMCANMEDVAGTRRVNRCLIGVASRLVHSTLKNN
jgi:hypothetical protein